MGHVLDKAAETVLADIQTNADQLNEQVEFEQQVQTRQQSLSQSKNQSHQQQSMLESQCSVNSTTSIKTIQQQSITHQKNKQQLINTNTNNNNNSSNNNNNSSSNNNSNNNNNNKTDNYTNQIRIDSIVGAATTIVISATQPPLPPSTTTASTTPKHTINNVNVNDVGHVAQQYHHQQFQQTIETATIATATATATTTTSQSTLNSSNNSLYFNNSQVISCALEVLPDNLLLLRHPSDSVNSLLEHIAPVNMSSEGILNIADVANLLHPQHAIITGGRSLEGCPLIVFPDNNCFNMLEEVDYQKLILYLTSVPSLQDADLGFHLIIDRRKDKWASVKTVLQRISVYFPGIIHVVYVLRPCGLFQKAISEVSTKFSKDEYRFRLITCSTLNDLHEYIDGSQLTSDMGGTLIYSHNEWIQQRISLENFSSLTHQVSADLDTFIQAVHDTEFPNSVEATQKLLDDQGGDYEKLKYEILAATKHGENLLNNIKLNDEVKEISERAGHVSSIERLLVQLEETERRFDEFWQTHYNRLQQCLELRKFESGFRELQHTFDGHLKSLSDTLEIGTSVVRVDELLDEMKTFEQQCQYDVEKTKAIIEVGQQLIVSRGVYPWEIVQPKCDELQRVCNIIEERLKKRHETLCKNRELMETIDKANVWCMNGEKLLTAKPIEKCSIALELIEENVQEIETFLASANEFKLPSPDEFNKIFFESTTAEIKALLSEIHQKIDDVSLRCDKRIANLKKLLLEAPRPMQTPEKTVPLQPPGGAPNLLRRKHKTDIIHELRPRSVDGIVDTGNTAINGDNNYCHLDNGDRVRNQQDLESRRQTRGHILNELLETERIYVHEINSIIKGYCDQMHSEEMKHLVPASLHGKEDILFGNLHEIYTFHNDVFLKDLENCISTTELVALCFVQRRDTFYRLYSFYCQNVPRSDHLRETLVDTHLFLQECQKRLGHRLSLGAYLLKPVQRISKYQLLLKDLLRHSDSGNCTKELQKALDCMLIVLKCVNDSMHQVAISGFPADLAQQGELLLQDSFQVWSDSKKDIRLRLKPRQRYIFLYQKSMLFCKQTSKAGHDKTTYQFKHYLKMSQIGLTESVRGDSSRFEVWLQGRQEVHTLQAHNLDIKNKWVAEIKRVLFNQLEELKGEKIKQYGSNFRGLRQTTSWDTPNILLIGNNMSQRSTISTDASSESSNRNSNCSSSDDNYPIFNSNCGNSTSNLSSNPSNCTSRSTDKEHADKEACGWSSDYSNSEDEMSTMVDNNITTPRFKNFLIPWSSHHHHQHNRGTLATNTHLQHEYHQNQSQQQQHHHHRNQNNYDHHYSCKRESQQKSSHNTQNNCLLHSQRNNNKSNSKFYVPVEH